MLTIETGEKLDTQGTNQVSNPVLKRKRTSSLLNEGNENIKVAKFCIDDDEEKKEYEKILNDSSKQIFRDSFIFDKGGRAIVMIWYYS